MADNSKTVERQRGIQAEIAEADSKSGQKSRTTAMQAGARDYPEPPFPKQHQPKPGDEASSIPRRCTTRRTTRARRSWRARSR